MDWRVIACGIVVLFVAPVAQAITFPLDESSSAPVGAVDPSPAAQAPRASASHLEALLREVGAQGIPTSEQDAPPGILGLRLLLAEMGQEGGNETNETLNQNGTHSHHHTHVSDEGLGSVWISAFHGVPTRIVLSDLDDDGTPDAIVGSEVGVTAVSGATGGLLWARHIGSPVTGLVVNDVDGDRRSDVLFSTSWGGQNPRVAAVRGTNGEVLWEFVGATSGFLGLTLAKPEPGSDVMTAATNGTVYRLSGTTGQPVWKISGNILPAAGAIVVGAYNLGHYLFGAYDLTGDGVADPVTVSLHEYYAYGVAVYSFDQYSLVNAFDGKTGQRLWAFPIGAEPSTFSFGVVFDLEGLDARGDGSKDVGVVGLNYRYYQLAASSVESYLRVIDGSSVGVGQLIGARSSAGPFDGLQLERYLELERTDMDGDHRDEVYVLATLLVDQVLEGQRFSLQRFSLPPGAAPHATSLLLSDVNVGFHDALSARLLTYDVDGQGKREAVVLQRTRTTGVITRVPVSGDPVDTLVPGQAVRAIDVAGTHAAVATTEAAEVRSFPSLGPAASRFALRGAPRSVVTADYDGDSYPDIFVLSSDGNAHIIDGITGQILAVLDWNDGTDTSAGFRDLRQVRFPGDAVPDYIMVRNNGTAEGWDGATKRSLWKARALQSATGPVWFDGNGDGILDLVSTYSFSDRTLTAINGADGKTLWSAKFDTSFFFLSRMAAARFSSAKHDDIFGTDQSRIAFAIAGDTGQILWKTELKSYTPVFCAGAVDHEGDGTQVLYVVSRSGDRARIEILGASGSLQTVPFFDEKAWSITCSLHAVERGPGLPGSDLLGSFAYWTPTGDIEFSNGFALYSGSDWKWKDIGATPPEEWGAQRFLGADANGPDGGRFYFGRQDHVYAKRLRDGQQFAEFTINGPFVTQGTVLDLDRSAPAEAIVITSDGLVWSLAEDPKKVLNALDNEAVRLGKEPPSGASAEEVHARSNARNRLPGPEPLLLLGVLALVVVARRRRA